MVARSALQRPSRPAAPVPELRQRLAVALAGDDRPQDALARHPHDVAQHVVQLHVHLHQRLLRVLHRPRALPHQLAALAQVRPQRAVRVRRPERPPQEPVPHQLPDPLAVLHVALAARRLPRRPRVHEMHVEPGTVQQLEHRDPVHARRLHRHLADPPLAQPLRHPLQVPRERAEPPNRAVAALRIHRHVVRPLADVDPRAVRVNHLEARLPPLACHPRFLQHDPRSRRADRGGRFTLACGVAAGRATNVRTPITVRAKLTMRAPSRTIGKHGLGPTRPTSCHADARALFPVSPRTATRGGKLTWDKGTQHVDSREI